MISKRLAASLALGLVLALAAPKTMAAETVTNADVVDMARAGLDSEVIITKINASQHDFDLSTRAILQLKESGVGDAVIKAMLAPAAEAAPAPSGAASGDRLRSELANVASGSPEARDTAVAWFVANRAATVPTLRNMLSEANPANRAAAALVLGILGDSESIAALRNLLTDASPEPRKNAAQALSLLNDQPAFMAAEQALQRQVNPLDGYIRVVGYARLTRAAGTLGQILESSPETANRAAAAWALGEIGRAGIAGRPAIEKALASDPEPEVRREAAAALAKFNDPASAASLQNACSLDPAVRKVTLAALADYPEAVPFLVTVMSLGPDQIAADESETARASLVRLTGQDFGLDGQRWNEWYNANRTLFPGPAAATAASAPAPALSDPTGFAGMPSPAAPSRGQVDMMEAWSIVADSSAIPTAPLPASAGGGAGIPALPPGAFGAAPGGDSMWGGAASAQPASPWSDSGGGVSAGGGAALAPAGSLSSATVPTLIPDVDVPDGAAPAPGTAGLRTWSSDPGKVKPAQSSRRASADGDNIPGWASPFEPVGPVPSPSPSTASSRTQLVDPTRPRGGSAPAPSHGAAGDEYAAPADAGDGFASPGPAIAAPAPAPTGSFKPAPPPSGISLPVPPMGDLAGGGQQETPPAPPPSLAPPFPAASTAGTSDGDWSSSSAEFSAQPGGEGTLMDPYADSDWSAPMDDSTVTAAPNVGGTAGEWAPPTGDAPPDALSGQTLFEDPYGEWTTAAGTDETPAPPAATGEIGAPDHFPSLADPESGELFTHGEFADEGEAAIPAPAPVATPAAPVMPPAVEESERRAVEDSETAMPPAASEPEPEYRSDLFVEPEPGQVVITDDYPQGRIVTAPSAPPAPAAPVSSPAPSTGAPETGPSDDSESGLDAGAEAAPQPGAEPAPAPAAGKAVFKSSSPAMEPPAGARTPAEGEGGSPSTQYLAPPPSQDRPNGFFFDPSVPLPPVRPEGTISAPAGKEVPLLGEGMFGK